MNMRTYGMRTLLIAVATTLCTGTLRAEVNPKPFVVPELKEWTGAEGYTLPSGRIVIKSNKLRDVSQTLAQDYEQMCGKPLTITTGSAKAGDIVLALKNDKLLGQEGYRMNVDNSISLTASTPQGIIWATRTLLQITEQTSDKGLPKGKITDQPDYRLRGFMIDCGRKFIPITYLRHLARVMSYYKMNTLQIHLNDNGFRKYFGDDWSRTQSGFRMECDTYPGLTSKDGHYTKQEFIDLQILAEQYGVEIIPEFDAPAHSLAFTQYDPSLGSKEYGMDHLDLFNPQVYTFMDNLWREYLDGKEPVFRGPRVHIGTDEYSNAKKEVVEKFRAFTDHYIRYVESFGKQAVLWGALTHANGDTPVKHENVLMDIWYNGYADPVEMKKQGYQLISIPDGLTYIVPAAGYYYDYLNCEYLYDKWTPAQIGNEKFDEHDPAILGGMFAEWNDHAGNGISVKDIHDRLYPALQTLAVKFWRGAKTSMPYAEFNTLRLQLSEAPGVNEAARWNKGKTLSIAELQPGQTTGETEVGYGYRVDFNIKGAAEEKGTVLFESKNATFYLADPEEGKLGFAREGYLNKFNYKIPEGKKVSISITGDNTKTCLYVDGKLKEELGPLTIYAMKASDRTTFQNGDKNAWQPVMYNPQTRMYYQRTLVFPLAKAGAFKSKITDVRVSQK